MKRAAEPAEIPRKDIDKHAARLPRLSVSRQRHAGVQRGALCLVPHLDAAVFADAGKVASRVDDLDLQHLKKSYGAGFRVHNATATLVRLDVGHSVEGWQVFIKFNARSSDRYRSRVVPRSFRLCPERTAIREARATLSGRTGLSHDPGVPGVLPLAVVHAREPGRRAGDGR
jgi:hypothetical protein